MELHWFFNPEPVQEPKKGQKAAFMTEVWQLLSTVNIATVHIWMTPKSVSLLNFW
jgi:hypothetical protein